MTESILGETNPHVFNRMRNIVKMYERWGKVEDAKKWNEKISKRKLQTKKEDLFANIKI